MAAHVGHAAISPVAGPIDLDWSEDALADLDRFAAFLHDHSPELAVIVAEEIIARAQVRLDIRNSVVLWQHGKNTARS